MAIGLNYDSYNEGYWRNCEGRYTIDLSASLGGIHQGRETLGIHPRTSTLRACSLSKTLMVKVNTEKKQPACIVVCYKVLAVEFSELL